MDLIVFDVDGTLVDSAKIIIAAQTAACTALGLTHPGREKGLSVVGLSLPLCFGALLGSDAPAEALAEQYRTCFNALRQDPAYHEPLYPGVLATIERLKARDDVLLGIATGKSRRGVSHLIERHGWDRIFTTIQTADNAPSKPHPAMLEQAMAETGIAPERTFMIGDSCYDMQMARAAGCRAVAVSWGFQPVPALVESGAQHVLETMAELPDFVLPGVNA